MVEQILELFRKIFCKCFFYKHNQTRLDPIPVRNNRKKSI